MATRVAAISTGKKLYDRLLYATGEPPEINAVKTERKKRTILNDGW